LRKDRWFCATVDRGHSGKTNGEASGGTRERFLEVSRFESERPTANAQRPTLNSEDY